MDNQPTNPTPTPAPEPTPAEPVAEAPVNETVNETPVETPAEPAAEPVAEPVAEPAVEPEVPAEAPAEEPVATPVEAEAPTEAPSEPVEAPVETPVAEPAAAPVIENAAPAEPPVMPGFITPSAAPAPAAPAAPAKKSNTTLILGIILGVVVVAAAGVGAFMLLNNNKDTKPTPTAAPAPEPVSAIKTVNCKASGNAWSLEQTVVVDEDEQKVTELGFKLMADYAARPAEDTTTDDSEIVSTQDPEQQAFMAIALMAMAFKQAEPVDGVKITDNSTETKVDLTYKAVREDIEDETTLEQFKNNDGKTAEELKEEAESSSNSESGVVLKCTIEE